MDPSAAQALRCAHFLTPTQTESKKRVLCCQECGLAVARPSHLARHLQSHLPPARRDHFTCTECGRQFSRNDVLLRHLRTAHQAYISRKRTAQKSCFRCVKKKLKCDRDQPCLPCTKSGAACEYAIDESTTEAGTEASQETTEPNTADGLPVKEQAMCENNGFDVSNPYQDPASSHMPVLQANNVYIHTHPQSSAGPQAYSETAQYFQSTSDANGPPIMTTDMTSFATMSPTDGNATFTQPYIACENAYLPAEFNFFPSNSAPRIAGMAEGGLDWLGLELDSPNKSDARAQSMGQIYSPGSFQYLPNQPMMLGDSEALMGRLPSSHAVGMQHSRPKDNMSTAAQRTDSQTGTQQWPFDHTRNPEPQKHKLPPLRDILQGTITSSDSGSIIRSLVQLLSTPCLPDVESADMNMMSAMDVLKNSLDLYFTEFHAVLPLVHIPTFNMAQVPTVTLASMSCIGAMYSDDRQGTEQASSLSEMCIQMIAWLASIFNRPSTYSNNNGIGWFR